jgi:hypothetical protein
MPLDAQDKLALESLTKAWEQAVVGGEEGTRARLIVAGRELTRGILEHCPHGQWRSKALSRLTQVISAIRACQDEAREPTD